MAAPSTLRSALEAVARARRTLIDPLRDLQAEELQQFGVESAIQASAAASDALFQAEQALAASSAPRAKNAIFRAMQQLTLAIDDLRGRSARDPALNPVIRRLAQVLALLYPAARLLARQRRDVQFGHGESMEDLSRFIPSVPTPPRRGRFSTPPFEGDERRKGGERVLVEIDVGLHHSTRFHAGLSLDVSRGGVFVAARHPLPSGTALTLYFALPNGTAVQATGTVRWTRSERHELPGMGIAFDRIEPEALDALTEYCATTPVSEPPPGEG